MISKWRPSRWRQPAEDNTILPRIQPRATSISPLTPWIKAYPVSWTKTLVAWWATLCKVHLEWRTQTLRTATFSSWTPRGSTRVRPSKVWICFRKLRSSWIWSYLRSLLPCFIIPCKVLPGEANKTEFGKSFKSTSLSTNFTTRVPTTRTWPNS